jgi:spore coat protein CotH
MKFRFVLIGLIIVFKTTTIVGQNSGFYSVDSIREIKFYFDEPNWDYILDSLYVDGEKSRLIGTVVIDGQQYDSVGIRYKGYSSVSVNTIKNPFNISLDYVIKDQEHRGYNKIKISNVIHDPSFIREVLSYEIARKYLPSSGANFANLYINDSLWGLYTNVEAVNKDFLSKNYSSREHPFFKCNPDNLNLYGENSNLSSTHGVDSMNYEPYYDMESDFGWKELYYLIDTLNNHTYNVDIQLNVDRTLWMHAFNYTLINYDSYIGYSQNYYLYLDNSGVFNPILWDLNMSFGSFRLADASSFYNGFSILEAQTLDPLSHYNDISVYPRPLLRSLFDNHRNRKMYIAHIRTIVEENFANQGYISRANSIQNLINTSVMNDTNKFYSYNDFQNNASNTVNDVIDYPGISELMNSRTTYLSNYPGYNNEPIIDSINYYPLNFSNGDDIWISAKVTDAVDVFLYYRNGSNQIFKSINMLDDGLNNDGTSNDSIYGAKISNSGNLIEYYIYAENDSAGSFLPKRAAYEFFTIQQEINVGDLVINELLATNQSNNTNSNGEYNDWIELFNPSEFYVSTIGLYLSDDSTDLQKWSLPERSIAPSSYLSIWADNKSELLGLHANFKLESSGETLILSYGSSDSIIDSITFPNQSIDVSYGRSPNGSGPFNYLHPSYNYNNDFASISTVTTLNTKLYPNPFTDSFTINWESKHPSKIQIFDINGRIIINQNIFSEKINFKYSNNLSLKKGIYFIKVSNKNCSEVLKLVKT